MPPRRTRGRVGKKDGGEDPPKPARRLPTQEQNDDDDMYQEPYKRIIRPSNQLVLSDKDMKEELTRMLIATDPNVPMNVTKYNYKEKTYKVDPPGPGDQLKIHFALDGCVLHKDSPEAKEQEALGMKTVVIFS